MKKKRAKLNFAGIIIVCILLAVLSVVRFTIPGTSNEYVGFIRAINYGIDYKGGVSLVFESQSNTANMSNLNTGVNAHIARIQALLKNDYNAKVYATTGSNVVVEIFNEYEGNEIEELINISKEQNVFSMKTEESATAEAKLTQEHIVDCYAMENSYYGYSATASKYGVYIKFTAAGRTAFKELSTGATSSSPKNIYFYIGDTLFQTMNIGEEVDQDYIFISGGQEMNTLEGAQSYAGRILSTKYDLTFKQVSLKTISKDLAQRNAILSLAILGIVVLATMIILVVRFKKLGLVNALALLLGVLIQIMMLQAVPNLELSASGFVGSLLCYVLGFAVIYYMLSKIAGEYAVGKKVHASFKFGFSKNYMTLVEVFLAGLTTMVAFLIFGSSLVKGFAYASVVGLIIYGLISIVISYWFNKMCLNINLEKAQCYGFKREANVNELEEI